jgi:LysR substrate binding domain
LVEDMRADRLDAAVVSLPLPSAGLHVTPLDSQSAVAALPVMHPRAVDPAIDLSRLAPERIVLLPQDTNPAFHDGLLAAFRTAELSPTLVHVAESRVELALLAVAAGAGLGMFPESVADRFAAPGIRFLPIEGAGAVCEAAVLTRAGSDDLPTRAFVRAVTHAVARTAAPHQLLAAA